LKERSLPEPIQPHIVPSGMTYLPVK
jgi:hypothetical protein